MRRTLVSMIVLLFACASLALAADSRVTTVFLVRHADKNPHAAGGDAGLSARGILRAQELVRVLADVKLAAVYSSPFPRARLTAEAVTRARRDSVRVYDPDRLEALAQRIRDENAGQNVLVVGHADTLPGTFEALTGDAFPDGEAIDYDKLYVVTLSADGSYRLLALHYGARLK